VSPRSSQKHRRDTRRLAIIIIMLSFQDVEKSYRQGGNIVHALRGASFAIDDTGFFAVMGPSGSGKSTLLHLAAGLDKPDRGQVIIDDYDIGAMSQRALTRMRREHVGSSPRSPRGRTSPCRA
jgi:putative ABC transport system ATP-binding protein